MMVMTVVWAYLLVLVGGHGDELGLSEGDVGDQTVAGTNADDVQLGLVLMEGVQHDLERTEPGSQCLVPSQPTTAS